MRNPVANLAADGYHSEMPSYALFALPGTGHQLLDLVVPAGMPPRIVVRSGISDFDDYGISCINKDDGALSSRLESEEIEFIMVAGWEERISPKLYLELKHGGWNIHPSILPRYRGHNPYFWVIANGETETGVTVHRLTDEFDAGEILMQQKVSIDPEETLGGLWSKLGFLGAQLAVEALRKISMDETPTIPQMPGIFPTAPRVTDNDLILRPDSTMEKNERLVRAANPYYGAVLTINGRRLKVYETTRSGDGPKIPCSDGALSASVLQVDGLGVTSGKRFNIAFPH